ncbi:MAG: ABC-ATPase domain-containing protein [Blautia sp.]|nr:ABC-ATPase domain-containing protein [Blautia sp.]
MQTSENLRALLRSVDRKSYPAYKSLKGIYQFPDYQLSIDHVQGDPFASPSHLTVNVPRKKAGMPEEYCKDSLCRTALADFLLREFSKEAAHFSFRAKGSGKSGLISVSHCGQEVLPRTACQVTDSDIIVRFHVGFPAVGRTISAGELERILFEFLPSGIRKAFFYRNLDSAALEGWIHLAEDQAALRRHLQESSLAAFVSDGAILPRASGVSDLPMKDGVPFHSPAALKTSFTLPHKGSITGMGIPRGITLIVGGGYHGKSTLLSALQLGVYDHIPGDGREFVLTDDTAMKIRSEDGRFVKDVDISLFINNLPNKKDTTRFSTEDASGSTSQAASIVEGMEAGTRVFLMDEDTTATNFMVRDSFMQRVISPEKEPITPFLLRARDLFEKAGISTILVAGSSGDFFHIADTIIQMDSYAPYDITKEVKALLPAYPVSTESASPFRMPSGRRVMSRPLPPAPKKNYYGNVKDRPEPLKVKLHGKDGFSLGREDVELRFVEQLTDAEQTAALGFLLRTACDQLIDGKHTVSEIIQVLKTQLEQKGPGFFKENGYVNAGFAIPRLQEIYACFNRFRRP